MSYRLIAAAAAAVIALQGCAPKPPAAPVATEDLNEGIAKTCTFSAAQPTPGGTVDATITMSNDGWCAYRATEKEGQPYLLGLVRQRPSDGELLVRKLGGETRVEYNPNPGFAGTDKFSVALRPQSGGADATVQITATVTPGAGVATAAPPPEEKKPATTRSRSTSRRTPRRSTP